MNKKLAKLYLFGDSICFGQLVSSHQTWATALAAALESVDDVGCQFVVQNAGVNGNTTRQALERIHDDLLSHSPDFVLIQFGMNDCNYWLTDHGTPRVSKKGFVANLEEIVEKAIAAGASRCILNTNHLSLRGNFDHLDDKSYEESNSEYSELIRRAYENLQVRGFQVNIIDIEAAWRRYLREDCSNKLEELLLEDGIHLSPAGHLLYREIVVPDVLKILSSAVNR